MRRGNSKTISTGKSEFESAEGIAKAILNASTESAMIIALDGTVLAINDIAAHRMGKTAAEVVGNCVYDFFSPEVRQSRKLRVEQAIQSKKQLRFQDEQGGRIFNNSIYPIADKEGYTKQVAIYARDITAQRKMEEALRISEEKFRNLADMLPQAVFELDLEGRFTFVNRIGLEFVGYTQEELEKGLNVLQMFIPADRERVKENIQRKLRGEKLGEEGRYYTALRKDGTSFPVYIHTSVIIHEKKPVGLRGLLIDDTERKEAEEALRKSKEKYQALSKLQEAILKTSFDAFSVVDFKGNFLFVDKTMTKLSGYSEEELLGLHLSNITVSPEFATHLIESARQKQRTIRLETSMIPKSTAPVPVELSSDLIEAETEEEERILVVFHDLRIEKELSEEIKLFRRFTADHVFISLFKMTSKGPAVVFTEPLLFAKDEDALLMQMGVYYTTALGQGSIINLGLFGPLPVPASNLVSLVYSFLVDDPAFDDPRSKGKTYAFVVLSIPETLIQLFTNRAAIRKIFEEELGKISIVQEVDLDFLTVLKNRIIGFDEEKEVK